MEGRSRKASPSCQSLPVFRFGVVVTEHLAPRRILRRQQLRPQPPPASPRLLTTRHRPEREIARPPGERLRHSAHQKEVRRTGEEEPPRHALLVDRPLDRPEEKGLALHLVNGQARLPANQPHWVAPDEVTDIEIVERGIVPLPCHRLLHERALTRLTGPAHDHGGHHPQPLAERPRGQSRKCVFIHVVNDNHSRCEWKSLEDQGSGSLAETRSLTRSAPESARRRRRG